MVVECECEALENQDCLGFDIMFLPRMVECAVVELLVLLDESWVANVGSLDEVVSLEKEETKYGY